MKLENPQFAEEFLALPSKNYRLLWPVVEETLQLSDQATRFAFYQNVHGILCKASHANALDEAMITRGVNAQITHERVIRHLTGEYKEKALQGYHELFPESPVSAYYAIATHRKASSAHSLIL